ncbi:restriction endonuclease subunit S [Flavobacterium sp. HJJ]|uniref:restriction endonuclease subunit S n=1 Tax=Flavobacterium sp. HJJ TaxID=2783792 RepID=UPI00188D955A|nr:restriction endonuclease subunit S [Flavobacterium sp. HJJ]MBF4473303.1 restriction endonuclease subunit S [Flavobacterium sp. HJJ]
MNFDKTSIGNVCIIGDGAHASIQRVEYGIPYLTSKNFNKEGINLKQIEYISEKDYQKHFRENSKALTKPKVNDLIFSIIGSIGGAYLYNSTDEFGLSSSVAIIRPDFNEVNSSYLLYYFKSSYLQKWVENIKSGSAQGFLSLEMIKRLPLILPPLSIQNKIASILSAYDELIENNKQRIKLLEEMAEEIYKEWFVRLRFPGYENTKIVDGLPEGWEEKEFDFFGDIVTGKTPSTFNEEYYNGTIPFVKTPDIKDFPYVISTNETLSDFGANSQKNKFIKKNSLIVSCIGSAGAYALSSRDCQTNQQINSIVFYKEQYSFYFYCFAYNLKPLLDNLGSNGATMTNVNKSKFEKMKIILPEEKTLLAFHNLIKNNFELILNLQEKNQLLQETRDLLLPRLISGKLSVEHLVEKEEELGMVAE